MNRLLWLIALILSSTPAMAGESVRLANDTPDIVHATVNILCENGIHKEISYMLDGNASRQVQVADIGDVCCWSTGYSLHVDDISGEVVDATTLSVIGRQWGPTFVVTPGQFGTPEMHFERFSHQGGCPGEATISKASFRQAMKP